MEAVRILITGGGAPGAPGIIKAIQQSNPNTYIFSCDVNEGTAGKILANDYFTVPIGDSESYVSELLQKCTDNGISVILPITTKEIHSLSKHKQLFTQNNISVIVSDFESLNIANNKALLYAHLQKHNVETPRFAQAVNYDQFKKAEKDLSIHPYIIKPCVGNGSRGFRIVTDDINEGDLLFNHKPSNTFITNTKLHSILSTNDFPPILVSEYMPGKEYTVDCLIENGIIKFIIPRRRDKMNNGISVAGIIEKNNDVIDYCKSILDSLNLNGPIGIQVKYSKNNKPLIVEINPRIQGTTVACIGAGVNIPSFAVFPNQLDSIQTVNDFPIKWGTQFIRHYNELYF